MAEERSAKRGSLAADVLQFDREALLFCGQQMREARNRLGMSLEDMAKRLNIEAFLLRLVENGAAIYPHAFERLLDSGLGIREEWLFAGEEPMVNVGKVFYPDAPKLDGLRELVYERLEDANDHTQADELFRARVYGLLGADAKAAASIIDAANQAAGALEAPMFEQGMRYCAQLLIALLTGRALVPPEGFRRELAEAVRALGDAAG